MKKSLLGIINLGVPASLDPEQAKFIQMSNLGSLLMITVNLPYLVLCAASGWTAVFLEICAVDALLLLTPLLNRRGHHLVAVFYFGTLLNLHLVFVTVAVGRESLLPLLIFYTAGGAVTLIRRGRAALMILALAGILGTYQAALALERAFGPLYALSPAQVGTLRLFVMYSVFLLIVVNALIARYGAITAEDRLRAETRRSEQALARETRFFQNVSHELRTPLTLILGPLAALQDGEGGVLEEAARSRLRMISRNARRLLRLINQLLDFSRLSSMRPRARPGDLAAFLKELAEPFAGHARKLGLRFDLDCAAGQPLLSFDPEIVEKIVSNLLSNACKFTPAGGAVRLELTDGPDWVRISVSDTGEGIAPAERERIFERFYRGTAGPGREGAGIGLSLARELAQVHGGTLRLAGASPRGNQFVLTLPRGSSGEAGAESPPVPSAARLEAETLEALLNPQGSGGPQAPPRTAGDLPSVLVVDDSADMRSYLRQGLEPRYRVLEAADGEQGLRQAREHLPRVIISDVMMPGMDGFALCRALREDSKLRLVPVILLTARAAPQQTIAGLEAGAVDYIIKPFSFRVLLAKVRGLLERSAEQERIALRDGLTGLLTRNAWEQDAERELARCARSGDRCSLAFLDLDDFKRVNDNHGHPAGDQVLLELARALAGQLRGTDLVGRYGGEEFVVLLPGSCGEAAVRSIQRVLEVFRDRCEEQTPCTFSAGVAEIAGAPRLALADYLARADEAMYRAKKQGKRQVLLWRQPF